jgi:carboxymethylenebutenolidase
MCYGDDARPPLPPVGGAAADHGDITLTSADGTKFMAHYARAAKPTGAGMVVLPDVRGLHEFFRELARRFAEAGIDAVAIDHFARTADTNDRSDKFEYMPHVQQTKPEEIAADVAAAIEYLKSEEGGATKSVFTVGFCFGGSNSWNQSAAQPELAGAIGFYGRPVRSEPYLAQMKAPRTRRPRPSRTPSSSAGSKRRACPSRLTSTRARRTASSTGHTLSGKTPATTRGGACWTS